MSDDFPDLKDGDALEPWHFNVIYDELRRWRKIKGLGDVDVSGALGGDEGPTISTAVDAPLFVQLTSTYSSGYSWAQVLITPGRGIQTTGVVGSVAAGNPAFELQTGDSTLTVDGTVYEAWRTTGAFLVFDGKN